MVEVLRWGYQIPFVSDPPLSAVPIPLPSYSPSSIKGKALQEEIEALIAKRGCRTSPVGSQFLQSPVRGPEGFRVMETCDRPVIIEQVRSTYAVQDGIQSVGSPVHQEFGLDDFHRSKGCLPSGSNSSIQQEVPEVCGRQPSLSIQGSLFRSLYGPSSVHKGHGSGVVFTPQPGRSYATISGRLAGSSLIPSGGSGGEGHGTATVQSFRNDGESREIVASPVPDGDLLGDGSGQPFFEGFSDSQTDRNRSRTNYRISILQAAKCGILARSLGSPDIVVSSRSGGPSLSLLSPASPSGSLGFCRRVGLSVVDERHSFRPSVVVGRTQHTGRGVACFPSCGPSLLVRRVRPGLGRPYWQPVCLRPLVAGRDWPVDQSPGVEGYLLGSSTLSVSACGVVGRGIFRQHHGSGLCSQTGELILVSRTRRLNSCSGGQ